MQLPRFARHSLYQKRLYRLYRIILFFVKKSTDDKIYYKIR